MDSLIQWAVDALFMKMEKIVSHLNSFYFCYGRRVRTLGTRLQFLNIFLDVCNIGGVGGTSIRNFFATRF